MQPSRCTRLFPSNLYMKETFRKIFISVLLSAPVASPLVMAQDPVADAVEAAKGAPRNQGLNRAAGDALKEAGRYAEAIQFYMKGGNLGNLGAAEAAYYMYDFEGARNYLDKYIQNALRRRLKRTSTIPTV